MKYILILLLALPSISFASQIDGCYKNNSDTRAAAKCADKVLSKRIKKLRSLIEQDSAASGPTKFLCDVKTCRKSTSVHHNSVHNCEFFKGYKADTVELWADNGQDAENVKVIDWLNATPDIVGYVGDSISCAEK